MNILNFFNQGQKENKVTETEVPGTARGLNREANNPSARKVFNLIILDESGSMQSIYEPAISGVNETLQTIRNAQNENPDQRHFVTLVAFDSGHYNEIYHNIPAVKAVDITKAQYNPMGMTPLYDAMGRAINELRTHVNEEGDVVLVTVITDGYENCSREYSGAAIRELVELLRKQNWVFTYIGANQNVEAVASSMSINNHMAFCADTEGTRIMFEKEKRSRANFFHKLSQCCEDHLSPGIKEDYFSEI